MYYEEFGSKAAPTIVFIHGGGMGGWMWKKQLAYFKDYHCIVPDLPEHGKNTENVLISIHSSALMIAGLIEKQANDGRAHVIGHSLGAKIIVELLSIRPELVLSAVVASALFRPIPLMRLTHRPFFYRLTVRMLRSKKILLLSAKQFKFPDSEYVDNYIKDFQALKPDTLYRIYDELYNNLHLPEGIASSMVPALIVAGEKEPKAMLESIKDMVKAMPKAEGGLIRGGLHSFPWVKHRVFNKIIDDWINDREIEAQGFYEIPRL